MGVALCLACGGSKAPAADSASASRLKSGVPRAAGLADDAVFAGPTVLFLGTSLTAGYGLDPTEAYPALVQRKADSIGMTLRVVNAGLSGETSAGALRRVDWLLRGPVDVFVLETGANDGLRALNIDSTRENIQAILDKVKASRPSALILLLRMEAPPNLGTRYTTEFREMFPALARTNAVRLGPFLLDGVAGEDTLNQADGMHPSALGSRVVAASVWRALGPLLDSLAAPRATVPVARTD